MLPGCTQPQPSETPTVARRLAERTTSNPVPGEKTGTPVSPGTPTIDLPPICVTANGQPISSARLVTLLVEGYGLDTLELLIRHEAAMQALRENGLRLTPDDIDAEYERALREIARPTATVADNEAFNRDEAEALLTEVLRRNNVPRTHFMLKVEHDAALRRLAEKQIVVRDDMLPGEYKRLYGERLQVRHIQLNDLREVRQAQSRLAAGEDFAAVARALSHNPLTAADGGLLPPFSPADESVPPLLVETARQLDPGQVSNPIYIDGLYHLIRLERRIPPSDVPLDQVRDRLRESLRNRLITERMQELAAEIFDHATLRWYDERLRRRFAERYPAHGKNPQR